MAPPGAKRSASGGALTTKDGSRTSSRPSRPPSASTCVSATVVGCRSCRLSAFEFLRNMRGTNAEVWRGSAAPGAPLPTPPPLVSTGAIMVEAVGESGG